MTYKLLIAVKSCLRDLDRGCHDVIRATWGKSLPPGVLLRFFVGAEANSRVSRNFKSDEVLLDCPDDYMSLSFKTREICRWTTTKMVSHVFLCDNDTFLIPKKLLLSGYENYDYMGKFTQPKIGTRFDYSDIGPDGVERQYPRAHPWASGGFGYFLSHYACGEVADEYPLPKIWAEDMWVGQVMGDLYSTGDAKLAHSDHGVYSWHFPQRTFKSSYDPKFHWMESMYEGHKGDM